MTRPLYYNQFVPGDTDDEDYYKCLIEDCSGVAQKRMLCENHYQEHQRAGLIDSGGFIPTEFFDDSSNDGQDRLDAMIEWIYRYDMDKLEIGLKERGITAYQTLRENSPWLKWTGYFGYEQNEKVGECVVCGAESYSRGLCKNDYNFYFKDGTINDYPTNDYIKHSQGYVNFVLKYHLQRVLDTGRLFGITFTQE